MQRFIWVGVTALIAAACGSIRAPATAPPGTALPSATRPAPAVSVAPATPGRSDGSPRLSMPIATVADFGADTPLFEDSFDDPASGWGTGSTQGGAVEYAAGALMLNLGADSNWLWSTRPLALAQDIVRVEAVFTPSAPGYQGLLCANSDELMYGGVANTEGRWAFMKLTDARADILTTEHDPVWTMPPQMATRLALDCAAETSGSFRMQLSLPDVGVAVVYDGTDGGPETLDRVGVYGEAAAAAYTLRVDDFSAFGGTVAGP